MSDTTNLKIAVVLHVYYLEMIPEILAYLSNIPFEYRLFITVASEKSNDLIKFLEEQEQDNYELIDYPNQGYDISPFLHVLRILDNNKYDLVCKVHTKNGASDQDKRWFECLMKAVLGTEDIVENNINAFIENKDLGMIGSANFYQSAQGLMYGNEEYVTKLLSVIDADFNSSNDWGFFAGTIFWARVGVFSLLLNNPGLEKLLNKDIQLKMKPGEPASVFHAFERVFGALPSIMNMRTGISHNIKKIRGAASFQLLSADFVPSPKSIREILLKKEKKPSIVVLGMHRSGTSVLSGLTSFFGFSPGADLMKPTKDNPKGYFENNKVVRLNDKILEDHYSSWRDYSFTVDEISPIEWKKYVAEAKKIILEENDKPISLLKDPRLCLLFPLWEQAYDELNIPIRIISVFRKPSEIARSLFKRNNSDDLAYEHSYMLWAHSFFQSELYSRKYPRLFVYYTKDFNNLNDLLERIGGFVDKKVTKKIQKEAESFFSPSLNHHHKKALEKQIKIPVLLESLEDLICNSVIFSTKEIDILRDRFYSSNEYLEFCRKMHNYKIISFVEANAKIKTEKQTIQHTLDEEIKRLVDANEKTNSEKNKIQQYLDESKATLQKLKSELNQAKILLDNKNDENKQLSLEAEKIKAVFNEYRNNTLTEISHKDVRLAETKQRNEIADRVVARLVKDAVFAKKLKHNLYGYPDYELKKLYKFIKNDKADKKLQKEKAIIADSGLFSPIYYLTNNPDIWKLGYDPLDSYCKSGWKEARRPGPDFDPVFYWVMHPEVPRTINPLIHYIEKGKQQGLAPFGVSAFLDRNIPPENFEASGFSCCDLYKYTNNKIPPIEYTENALVSILIINRNGVKYLQTLIPMLYENTKDINYEVIVVDNNSDDHSVFYLESIDLDIPLTIIKNENNESFSVANNQAAKQAKGKYLVLLNNDVEPMKGWLNYLLQAYNSNENTGSVGARLVYPFKHLFAKSCQVQHAGIAFRYEGDFYRPYNMGNGKPTNDVSVLKSEPKSTLTAACLLVPKAIYLEVGGLDEQYLYGYEDVDFGLKLTQKGYANIYASDAVLFHHEFGTQDKDNPQEVVERRQANLEVFRNKWFRYIKHAYWKEKIEGGSHLFAEQVLTIAIIVTDHGDGVTAGDYFTAQELALELEEFGWHVIFLGREKKQWYQIPEEVDVLINLLAVYDLREIPNRNKRLIKIGWVRNWFDRWCENESFNDYDFVFSSSQQGCEYLQENSDHIAVSLMPLATNTSRFCNSSDIEVKSENKDELVCDICFTGSYWNHPRDIINSIGEAILTKYSFHIYGANWGQVDKFKPYYKGFVDYQEMPAIYHSAKIVIDDANHVTKPYASINSRVFDAIASGTLVITNGVEGSKALFGGELPCYETPKELEELLDYYLANEDARAAKINVLRQIVLDNHSYKHRAELLRSSLVHQYSKTVISIKIPTPSWENVDPWGDYHVAVMLKKSLEKEGFSVILQVLSEWDNEDAMECDVALVLRGLERYNTKPHQINIMWNISHPDMVNLEEYEEYDVVCVASDYWAKELKEKLSVPVEVVHQCTDIERFHPPTKEEQQTYHQELLFVGNSRGVHRKILKDLLPTKYDLKVVGGQWKDIIPQKYWQGSYLDNNELYKHYGAADILLNDHWDDMREKGFVSNRIYDGLACGAFIVSDTVRDMGEIKNYICTYETAEELKEIIAYYLSHPEERQKIIGNAVDHIKQKHTFENRAKQFSKLINVLL